MQKIVVYILILAGAFTSCEKVIDIPLDDAAKKYVIEGVITDQQGGCKVLVSQTKNFTDDNSFNGVGGAVISITDNNNSVTVLSEDSAGVYTSDTLTGIVGNTYTLNVTVNGTAFTASCAMPSKVNMDTLYITDENIFGEIRKTANVEYHDPVGVGNNYRFVLYRNDEKKKNIYIRNDEYSDGNVSVIKLFLFGDEDNDTDLKSGDHVKVDMLCIADPVYKYWYSLNEGATGDNNSASPANPVSNISGGALGYFSAHTIQSKNIVVP
ncbi:MAG: DUF4249 domain-containing protein [Agriterribacter sp.]